MIFTEKTKKTLFENWGDKADALDCYCEVKFTDPLGGWDCYIFAINPYDQEEISCLIADKTGAEVRDWSFLHLLSTYNREGKYPVIDHEFRRVKASHLFRKLNGEK